MKKKAGQKIITFFLILSIITGWLYSGWPQIWQNPPVPLEIPKVKADFQADWGVIAFNTNKSIYQTGEEAFLQMAVLDEEGKTVCDANLELIIRNKETGREKKFSTQAKKELNLFFRFFSFLSGFFDKDYQVELIQKSNECGEKKTSIPDYFAYYNIEESGIYEVEMKVATKNGSYSVTDQFEVRQSLAFDIERIGSTRIYPPAVYEMMLRIKANQDFRGEVIESMPVGFEIISHESTQIRILNDTKEIIWDVDWQAGENYELKYTFDTPDISPYLYLLGPLELRPAFVPEQGFVEVRKWQIAADAIGFGAANATGGSLSTTVNIGTADTNRLVAVFAGSEADSAIPLSGVTVDTKSCDWVTTAYNTNSLGNRTELWYCDESHLGSSNGSVTVAITGTDTLTAANWAVHAIVYTGVAQSGPNDSGIDETSVSPTTTISVPDIDVSAGGVVVMGAHNGTQGLTVNTYTSPLSEQTAADPGSADGVTASGIESSAQSNKTYTATWSSAPNRSSGVVASWDEAPTYTLAQNDWRWYENADNVQPGTAKANENTAITGIINGEVLRIRTNITVGGSNMAADDKAFKLQYGQGTDCTAIGTWYDVGAIDSATIWRGYNNSTPADGATIGVSDYLLSASDVAESYEEENNSVNNPRAINDTQDGEWDWVVQENGATANTTYCFRMIYSDDTALDSYNADGYPKLTTIAPATWRETEDTPIPTASSALDKNTNVRLRIEVANTGYEASNYDYRLEYASTATDCSSDPGGWVTVPVTASAEHFEMTDSIYFIDGYPTSARLANSESYTFTAGTMVEDSSNSSGNITLPYNNYTEIEFVFQANNNATDGGTYCFRVTKAGTALDNYSIYPQVQIAGVANQAPTVDSINISPSPITLNADTTKTVTITATITDNDGCEDVFTNGSITGVFFDDVAEDDTCTQDDNDCYASLTLTEVDDTCTGAGDYTADASADVNVWFIANPSSSWTAKVTATDEASESGSNTQTVTINTLIAFDLDIGGIAYGTVNPDNISSQQAVLITTTGNVAIDVQLSGTNLTWSGNTILVGQQKYSASSGFDWETQGTALTGTPACHELSTGKPTEHPSVETENVYWKLKVPTGKAAGGPYTGTNYFDVVSETTCP